MVFRVFTLDISNVSFFLFTQILLSSAQFIGENRKDFDRFWLENANLNLRRRLNKQRKKIDGKFKLDVNVKITSPLEEIIK